MYLVYFDESGNSGNNLNDPDQPIFALGALIVGEGCWQAVESDLEKVLLDDFPDLASSGEEIHGGDLRAGRKAFKGVEVARRIALRDSWLQVAVKHKLKFVYRSIEKKRFQVWSRDSFGSGVDVNPYVASFALVSMVLNRYLVEFRSLGIFIFDENKEIARDVEKSIRTLRLTRGPLHLSQVVEKGFFIDSRKSRVLQLCDLCVLHARKKEEINAGLAAKPFDADGIKLIEPLIVSGDEKVWDVIAWLKQEAGGK